MRKKLEVLEKSEETQKNFNFEFTTLIKKTISKLNDSVEIINHHSKMMEVMNGKIENLRNEVGHYDLELNTQISLTSLTTRFNAIYFATDNRIRDLHQSLIDLQSNVMNTRIVTFDNIIDALKKLPLKDESITFPIDLQNPDYETLRKLTKYVVMIQNDDLIIVYSVPLREDTLGKVQKFYSIPTIEEDVAKFLDLTNNYVISDKNLNKYVDWTRELFNENCIKIDSIFYCKGLNVMSKEQDSCTYKVLVGFLSNIEEICGIRLLRLHKTLLIKTEEINKYLTVSTKPDFGSLILDEETKLLEFKKTQMLCL